MNFLETKSAPSLGQIYTVGYGAKSLVDFRAILGTYSVQYLIDVRSSPYSKYRPEYSREPLKNDLGKYCVKYVFMGDQLGGRPNDDSCYDCEGKVDYSILEKKPYFITGLARIMKAEAMGYKICLMCSEEKPEDCHRSKLIGRILASKGLSIVHIVSQTKTLSQVQVINLLCKGQPELFSDSFKSRKTYAR